MWFFKLFFLLALNVYWIPAESHVKNFYSSEITIDLEGEEEEEQEEGLEEEVVV